MKDSIQTQPVSKIENFYAGNSESLNKIVESQGSIKTVKKTTTVAKANLAIDKQFDRD